MASNYTCNKYIIYLSVLFLFAASCSKVSRLQQTLEDAGSNREELEKVLSHYSLHKRDSLKYRAAKYLIENMRFHYTYTGVEMGNYYNQIDSLIHDANVNTLDLVKNKIDSISTNTLNKLVISRDVKHVNSNFLISHIENAFLTRDYHWNKNLDFNTFCEYVLPYRIKDEPIENWMPTYTDFSKHIADSVYKESNSYKDFITRLYHFFNENTLYINKHTFKIKNTPSSLIGIRYGTCQEIAMLGVYIFRSLGIPLYYDFTPNWANRSLGHDWNGIDIEGEYHPFIFQAEEEFGHHLKNKPYEKFGKIYRSTYTMQDNSLIMQFERKYNEKIPQFLSSPYIQDISNVYSNEVATAKLKLSEKKDTPFAYISIFNNSGWVPIGWSKIENNEVAIQDVQKGCCYLTTIYHDNNLIPVTYPFIIPEKGCVRLLIPDKDSLQSITMERKYPNFAMQRYAERSVGGEFHGSNNRDFAKYDILHTVDHTLIDMKWHTKLLTSNNKYKYLRYYSAEGGHNNIAEINFIGVNNTPIYGNIIAEGEFLDSKAGLKENAFDEDPLTFFGAKDPDNSWVGLELAEKTQVDKIKYLFRNDDNNIRMGDVYELLYWDNSWISLGKKEGISDSLSYSNCPTNALFLLRNHTRGKEERIFTYKNNKQVWW